MSDRYTFTADQLARLLGDAIELFLEYQAQHGKTDDDARRAAVAECFEALDAESALAADGLPAALQTLGAPSRPPSARRKMGLYEYLMSVADTLERRYGQHGTADALKKIARPVMGIDPSVIELLDTDIDELGKDADE